MRLRPGSPVPGASTFTTSAPSQAKHCVQAVPASYWVMSRMRKPSSAAMCLPPLLCPMRRVRQSYGLAKVKATLTPALPHSMKSLARVLKARVILPSP